MTARRIPILLLALALAPGAAMAHYPWLTPAGYAPPPGQALPFRIGWGHDFPGTDTLPRERLLAAELLDGEGNVLAVPLGPGNEFATPPLPGTGPWVLAVRQAPGYYSRTPRGGQRSSRADNPDALSCSHSTNTVKALLGSGAGAVAQPLGHPLEILPLAASAGTTAPFEIRLLFRGAPWQGEVNATYEGFDAGEPDYPLTVTADADGRARLSFDRPGRWLIKASASEPYPDPATCDRNNYNATLTLVVR